MDDAAKALIMAFSVIVFVIALSFSIHMIAEAKTVTDVLVERADITKYFDHVKFEEKLNGENNPTKDGTDRFVSAETIIPVLYRYYKENFCVKIYGVDGKLIQVFDVKLEGDVHLAVADTKVTGDTYQIKKNLSLKKLYDDKSRKTYMFGAPWLGSTKSVKTRVDYFVNGEAGFINNQPIDYRGNDFYKARNEFVFKDGQNVPKYLFQEHFNIYAYTGDTMETEDGDILVTGAEAKDKVLISYYMVENPYIN